MDKWTFGLTMLITGMGGTIAVLIIFSLVMVLLKRIFPFAGKKKIKKLTDN